MALLGHTFNTADLPQSTRNFDPLPDGWYDATVTSCEIKPTKAGTGQYLAVRYDISSGEHQGRVVFGNITLRNQNIKAEEIGHQQLGELMRACGLESLTDSDELIGNRCTIKLVIKQSEQYGPSNEVKGFKASASKPAAAPAATTTTAKAAPPWAKR